MRPAVWLFGFALAALPARAQDADADTASLAETVFATVPASADDTVLRFLHKSETETCASLRKYLTETVLGDKEIQRETATLSTSSVAKTASKYATALAEKYGTDFLFYHPNTRYFIRINDKSYRGRIRLGGLENLCYWERLPSQDIVYSVLVRAGESGRGFFKASKRLTKMTDGLSAELEPFGKNRIYTALDKTGLKKLSWYKMRRSEPDGMKGAGWCTAENMAFLTSHGTAPSLPNKVQKKLLSMAAKNDDTAWADLNMTGGIIPISDVNGQQIAAIIYTVAK